MSAVVIQAFLFSSSQINELPAQHVENSADVVSCTSKAGAGGEPLAWAMTTERSQSSEISMNESEQRLLDILDRCRKIEFFIPFNLKQILDTPDAWSVKWVRISRYAEHVAWVAAQFHFFEQTCTAMSRLFVEGRFSRSDSV